MSVEYATEDITCHAGVWRIYQFTSFPAHKISIPMVTNATSDVTGCFAIRDLSESAKIKVYSPITQDVTVAIIFLK